MLVICSFFVTYTDGWFLLNIRCTNDGWTPPSRLPCIHNGAGSIGQYQTASPCCLGWCSHVRIVVVFVASKNILPWTWQPISCTNYHPTPLSHIFSNRFAIIRRPSDEMDELDDGYSREQLKSSSLQRVQSALELLSCDDGGRKLTSRSDWQVYREVLPAMLWRWPSWLPRIGETALLRVGRHCCLCFVEIPEVREKKRPVLSCTAASGTQNYCDTIRHVVLSKWRVIFEPSKCYSKYYWPNGFRSNARFES